MNQSLNIGQEEVAQFIMLREIWAKRMPTIQEAIELRDMEDAIEKLDKNFKRVTPKRKGNENANVR